MGQSSLLFERLRQENYKFRAGVGNLVRCHLKFKRIQKSGDVTKSYSVYFKLVVRPLIPSPVP